jgi:hypothetical protein
MQSLIEVENVYSPISTRLGGVSLLGIKSWHSIEQTSRSEKILRGFVASTH